MGESQANHSGDIDRAMQRTATRGQFVCREAGRVCRFDSCQATGYDTGGGLADGFAGIQGVSHVVQAGNQIGAGGGWHVGEGVEEAIVDFQAAYFFPVRRDVFLGIGDHAIHRSSKDSTGIGGIGETVDRPNRQGNQVLIGGAAGVQGILELTGDFGDHQGRWS